MFLYKAYSSGGLVGLTTGDCEAGRHVWTECNFAVTFDQFLENNTFMIRLAWSVCKSHTVLYWRIWTSSSCQHHATLECAVCVHVERRTSCTLPRWYRASRHRSPRRCSRKTDKINCHSHTPPSVGNYQQYCSPPTRRRSRLPVQELIQHHPGDSQFWNWCWTQLHVTISVLSDPKHQHTLNR